VGGSEGAVIEETGLAVGQRPLSIWKSVGHGIEELEL